MLFLFTHILIGIHGQLRPEHSSLHGSTDQHRGDEPASERRDVTRRRGVAALGERQRLDEERASARKGQVGSGDRSERIRTYNFPQGRVTDHRINLTLYKLDQILQGDLTEIIDALTAADQADRLAELAQ